MKKYVSLLCSHIADVLPVAASLATYGGKHFSVIAKIVSKDVSGKSMVCPVPDQNVGWSDIVKICEKRRNIE